MFTIGICSSDRKDYLLQALESVYIQDFTGPVEVVVADDNSTLFSPEETLNSVVQAFGRKKIKIKLVKNQAPGQDGSINSEMKAGEAAMRNMVITHSDSETQSNNHYIIWLDDDDRLLPNTLSNYMEAISQNPEADVFYGNLIRTDENFKPQQKYQYRDIPRVLLPSSLLLGSMIPNGGSCIRKTVFEKIGLYDPSYKVATDYQFWARASLGPIRFKYIDKDVYLYRAHPNNAALDKEDDRFFDTNGRVCELLLQHCPPHYLFPFFEWKNNKSFAECQVTLSILTLAKRNRRNILVENCNNELKQNELFKEYLAASSLSEVLNSLAEATSLNFDQTAQILSKIVEAGQQKQK